MTKFLIESGANPAMISALDLNEQLIGWCQNCIPKVNFVHGDCTEVDQIFEPQQFDLVVSHMLFNHLDDDQFTRTLTAVSNVLKPGGTFSYLIPHPESKAKKHGYPGTNSNVFEEFAPWGGAVKYFYRHLPIQQAHVRGLLNSAYTREFSYRDVITSPYYLQALRDEGINTNKLSRALITTLSPSLFENLYASTEWIAFQYP